MNGSFQSILTSFSLCSAHTPIYQWENWGCYSGIYSGYKVAELPLKSRPASVWSPTSVILKLVCSWESHGRLVKIKAGGPPPLGVSDSVGQRWRLRTCIANRWYWSRDQTLGNHGNRPSTFLSHDVCWGRGFGCKWQMLAFSSLTSALIISKEEFHLGVLWSGGLCCFILIYCHTGGWQTTTPSNALPVVVHPMS